MYKTIGLGYPRPVGIAHEVIRKFGGVECCKYFDEALPSALVGRTLEKIRPSVL
jgi:hypothetical protein